MFQNLQKFEKKFEALKDQNSWLFNALAQHTNSFKKIKDEKFL